MNADLISSWRGFNLLNMFCSKESSVIKENVPSGFKEFDFKIIAELGFNFVRIPLSYRLWGDVDRPFYINYDRLAELDRAVEYAEKYNLHINIAMHRGIGYCINKDEKIEEKLDLWSDDKALDAFVHHWHAIAERYQNVSSDRLSFNIINEPDIVVNIADYTRVCNRVIEDIVKISPQRYFVVDGLSWGEYPNVLMMTEEMPNCIHSTRAYGPESLTHYRFSKTFCTETPVWPGGYRIDGCGKRIEYNKEKFEQSMDMWKSISEIYSANVMCGELGCANFTPHNVALAWLDDILTVLNEKKFGWAMWNLYGIFGIIDSERDDVVYEDFYGHKLDRKMLDIMQKHL